MRRRTLVLSLAVLLAALLSSSARGGRPAADQLWTRPDLDSRRIRSIAILPPVGDVKEGTTALEDRWFVRVYEDGRIWLPSMFTLDYLLRHPRQGQALLARLQEQIYRTGQVDSASATLFARALGADAVLLMRVDRWERVGSGITIAHVEATCALEDSSGHLLWRISGSEAVTARFGVPTGKVGSALPPSGDWRVASPTLILAAFTPTARGPVFAGTQSSNPPPTTPSTRPGTPPPGTTPAPGTTLPPASPYRGPSKTPSPFPKSEEEWRYRSLRRPLSSGILTVEGKLAPDFDLALKRLLDRWVPLFPKPAKASTVAKSS